MMVVPAGSFVMGEPRPERVRSFGSGGRETEVTIAAPFAIGKFEVTRAQFAAFLDDSGYVMDKPCTTVWQAIVGVDAKPTWQDPLYPENIKQADDHPVICVGWHDAHAYIAWLNETAGGAHLYYLPSESEWEYAARAGATGLRSFDLADACTVANVGDSTYKAIIGMEAVACTDGYAFTAPVGTFPAHAFGLHDMVGNVWEWTQDCWHPDHARATGTEMPLIRGGDCTKRVMRGGGFTSEEFYLRVSARGADPVPATRLVLLGFRVAATVPAAD